MGEGVIGTTIGDYIGTTIPFPAEPDSNGKSFEILA